MKRRYGICYSDGRILIRLAHVTTGRPLRYSSLVNTLCHELAHLRHMNHGPRFKAFYLKVLEWARRERIYLPGTVSDPARAWAHVELPARRLGAAASRALRRPEPRSAKPTQLSLF